MEDVDPEEKLCEIDVLKGWMKDRVEVVIGRYWIPGVNDSSKRLCTVCASSGMIAAKTYFHYKDVHKYIWCRHMEDRVERNMTSWFLVGKNMMNGVQFWRGLRMCFSGQW